MTAAKNDVTGDSIVTKISSEEYRNNFDLIFRKVFVVELATNLNGEEHEIEKPTD